MIKYIEGNLLESKAQALVNTVNTVGIMGKGIALQFKNQFPNNYRLYKKASKEGLIKIGHMFVVKEESLLYGRKFIINFPTKTDWRKPSEYSYITEGLDDLVKVIKEYKIGSIAIPPLGAGNGGLNWNKVKLILENKLKNIDCDILIYQPNYIVLEVLKKERAKLTPARAMLLSVLFDLVRNGEFVSEFAAEKVAYFLQRFGAEKEFNLKYEPNFYGPYSGKVKHVLYYLNGSYIGGYSTKDKKPFEELDILFDGEIDVNSYLNLSENLPYKTIVNKTKAFLSNSYSYFNLELLSTIDYIVHQKNITDIENIKAYLNKWSNRKKTLFSNDKFIQIALSKIRAIS